jgi:hypothetical protein
MNQLSPSPTQIVVHCVEALSRLPRLSYKEWITILSGLANEFGEETAFFIATQAGFRDERRNETAYKIRKRLKNVFFGSVVYILRQYHVDTSALTGFGSHTPSYTHAHTPLPAKVSPKKTAKAITPKTRPEPCIWRFVGEDTDEAEERAGIYQFDGGMSRHEAEKRVVEEESSTLKRERLYRCAVSVHAMNKTISCSWDAFMGTFKNTALSVDELQALISEGYAIAPFLMKGRKSQLNWLGAELCCVDVDGTMTLDEALQMELTQHCLFLYTSPSHTDAEHRFRLVFALPCCERDMEVYRATLQKLIVAYRADESCSDPSKFYFGNSRAWIWQPTTAFENGKDGAA